MSLIPVTYQAHQTAITAQNLNDIQSEIVDHCVTADGTIKSFSSTYQSNARASIGAASVADVLSKTAYAVCSTVGSESAKTVTISGFTSDMLVAGTSIKIKFANTNTAASASLNVSNTGGKPIVRYGTTIVGSTPATSWYSGAVVTLVYDGTYWVMT